MNDSIVTRALADRRAAIERAERAEARAIAVVYAHAPRDLDGVLLCAGDDFDGSTTFEAHVAAMIRAALRGDPA